MRRRSFVTICTTIVLLFSVMSLQAAEGPGSKYRSSSLRNETNGADYIVLAPDEFETALQPLLDHRSTEGLRVALVTTGDLERDYGMWGSGPEPIRNFLTNAYYHWKRPAPKYLLIVADAPAQGATATTKLEIPTGLLNTITEYREKIKVETDEKTGKKNVIRGPVELMASDDVYADMDGDGLPEIAVGRLPADSPEEVAGMTQKILNYEIKPPLGTWKRRVSFFASQGHFGSIDKLLEKLFKMMVRTNVSPMFEIDMTYANPELPYFFVPDRFNDKVIQRFNEGALIMNYIGHGLTDEFDDVEWDKKEYPIMRSADVAKINDKGMASILIIIACLTGNYDAPRRDSIAELLIKNVNGPIGVIASSVVSQPTSNGVLSKEIADAILMKRTPRIGDALVSAKRGIFENTTGEDRKLLDKFASTLYKKEQNERNDREIVFMYNLLGDPATKIAYPAGNVEIKAPEMATAGDMIAVSGKVDGIVDGEVYITLECYMTNTIYPIKPIEGLKGEELNKTFEENYANANNKVAWSTNVKISGGKFKLDIPIPAWLPKMIYYVKAYATGDGKDAAGFAEIKIRSASGANTTVK